MDNFRDQPPHDLLPRFSQLTRVLQSLFVLLPMWLLGLASFGQTSGRAEGGGDKRPVQSELVFEGMGSFGHYHVFAYSWWSYLDVGGVEYDRHSWGSFLGARRDYVAEILPIVLMRQPTKTDAFGDPLSREHKMVPGLAVSPVGMRLIWRDGKTWKPYYSIKGGMIAFTQKALSEHASYQNFSLQQSVGMQFKITPRWDFRVALTDFHFSNAFMTPANPGIDEMMYNGGLIYHLGRPVSQ